PTAGGLAADHGRPAADLPGARALGERRTLAAGLAAGPYGLARSVRRHAQHHVGEACDRGAWVDAARADGARRPADAIRPGAGVTRRPSRPDTLRRPHP